VSAGGWFGYWGLTLALLVFSAGYMFAEDGHAEGFSKWWFRAIACLSAFLVGFGLIMAVMGR
jgi:hypothetical protein